MTTLIQGQTLHMYKLITLIRSLNGFSLYLPQMLSRTQSFYLIKY